MIAAGCSVKVKICGITREADARLAESLGADYIGLIFARSSPRAVDMALAETICRNLTRARPIGVFVEHSVAEIGRIAQRLNLHAVQVYRRTRRPVPGVCNIRARRIRDRRSFRGLASDPADYVLLDAHCENAFGGTGRAFDWNLLPDSLDRVFLAGGIHPGNIRAAAELRPFAIDVCSGVERRPGVKSPDRLRRLFQEIR